MADVGSCSRCDEERAERQLDALRSHFMYVVECADATLYTGYAVDVGQRVAAHNAGRGAKYTRSRRPVVLLACAAFSTKRAAMSAEFRFKRLARAEKLSMIAQAEDEIAFAEALARRFGLDREGPA